MESITTMAAALGGVRKLFERFASTSAMRNASLLQQRPRWFMLILGLLTAASVAHAQDGYYDPSFGDNGREWLDVTGQNYSQGRVMHPLANGTLFIAGMCNLYPRQICATWLDPYGAYASGYGPDGSSRVSFSAFPEWPSADSTLYDAVVLADQRIAVLFTNTTRIVGIAVLKADGSGLDPSVGGGSFVTVSYNSQQYSFSAWRCSVTAASSWPAQVETWPRATTCSRCG